MDMYGGEMKKTGEESVISAWKVREIKKDLFIDG